jgi:hypothetical protein
MGLTNVAVKVCNHGSKDTFTANFLVDTGATDSMVPACELRRIGVQSSLTAKFTGSMWPGLSFR